MSLRPGLEEDFNGSIRIGSWWKIKAEALLELPQPKDMELVKYEEDKLLGPKLGEKGENVGRGQSLSKGNIKAIQEIMDFLPNRRQGKSFSKRINCFFDNEEG